MFLEAEDDSSATWAAAGDVGPGAQQQSKSQMPTGPSPTCIFLNFRWANGQHGLTPLVLLHDHALRPAAGTWARQQTGSSAAAGGTAGAGAAERGARPGACCGRGGRPAAARARWAMAGRRRHGRWLWGRATRRRDGRRMPGHADNCLLGRWAASRDQRSKAQGRQAAIARTKEH